MFWIQQCDAEYCNLLTAFRWILQHSTWKKLRCKGKGSVIYSALGFWQFREFSVPGFRQRWKQPFILFKFFPFLLYRTNISHRVTLPRYNCHLFRRLIISSVCISIRRQFSLGLNQSLLYQKRSYLEVSAANSTPRKKVFSPRDQVFLECFQL